MKPVALGDTIVINAKCIYFWGLRDEEINLYITGKAGGGGSTSIFLFYSLENHDIQDFTRL